MKELSWQDIAHRDGYLAGRLACGEWEWWMDETAESQADRVGLLGDRRADFLRGWQDEIIEREQERVARLAKERDEMVEEAAGQGDPAAR